MNIRSKIKRSETGFFFFLKNTYYSVVRFSIPAPKAIWQPIWFLTNFIRNLYYWLYRVLWVTPIFHGLCEKIGTRFRAGTFLPYVVGTGRIIVGDNVTIHGKADFIFGSIRNELPEIHIGNNTGIGHNVRFDVSSILTIGEDCLIAKDVAFHDSSGHHIDPESRLAKIKIDEKQVHPIVIGNNVWIGDGAFISPGTHIGDNCVISAMTMVGRRIPPNSLVYSTPAKVTKIRKLSHIL